MKIDAKITIAKSSGPNGHSISIHIVDEASGIQFFAGEMSLKDFAEAITGLSYCHIDAEVRGLENVGKTCIRENRRIEYKGKSLYDGKAMEAWLGEHGKEDGWIVSAYLGSQSSVVRDGKKTFLNYTVTKFVDRQPPSAEEQPT